MIFIFCLDFLQMRSFSRTLLKGGITTIVRKGENLELNIHTPLNLYYSQIGDKIAGFISHDIPVSEDFLIPKGSKVEGILTAIKKPKKFGQDGAFEISFNELVLPDGTLIPVYGTVTTDVKKTEEKIASIVTYDTALIAYGGFHGAIAGIQYGGIPLAIASHGISVLAGAGAGAATGVIGSIRRKGLIPETRLFSVLPLKFKTNFSLLGDIPETKNIVHEKPPEGEDYKGFRFYPSLNKEDIKIELTNITGNYSEIYGNYLVLQFNLENKSERSISLSNIAVVDSDEPEVLIHPDVFLSGTESFKSVKPYEQIVTTLAFLTRGKKPKPDNYSLVVVDSLDKNEILRIPLVIVETKD